MVNNDSIIKYGFFAYGSTPSHCGEFIEEAIKKINKSGHLVSLKSWKTLRVGGEVLISKVLQEIENSHFVCADITGLNENVLFELGFAVGKRKPVWIIQDVSIQEAYNRFKDLNFLTTVGYINYTKSDDIVENFLREKPFNRKEMLLDGLLVEYHPSPKKNLLLYLKSQYDTNYNQYITNLIQNYKLSCVIDDAVEVKVQPLSWYAAHLLDVASVLIEFSSTYRNGYELHNAKCSFIAGLAIGMGLEVQMVAEKPFPTAIDYQEYLKKFTSLDLCKAAVSPFLNKLRNNIAKLMTTKSDVILSERKESELQKIKFGEFIAEHEASSLYEYYVNTAHDEGLVKSEYNIVVGRKGSGKTATLYYMETALSKDIRNEVVAIKPVNFEIDGLVELLKKLKSDFEKGYIIQSIWKFLIYSEIAKHVYLNIFEKPVYAKDEVDNKIIHFVEQNETIILSDFSTRLEKELIDLNILESISEQSDFRIKVAEILHENIIKDLKDLIIEYMNKRKKLVVLIDNLDKNWRKGSNVEVVGKFILGLLGVIGRIAKELKGSPKSPNNFSLHLVVFLRSDIFKHVIQFAREPDKIEYTRLRWNDEEVLFRVLEKRIEFLSDQENISNTEFWEKYITPRVDGNSTKDFILSCIIPRPRDLIYFLSSAKSSAVSRGHNSIQQNDLISAYDDYSNWIFQSILVENGVTISQMQKFLYQVMGEKSILTRNRIVELMKKAELSTENDFVDYFISHLCSLSFIGRETRSYEYQYEYEFEIDNKIQILAEKLNSNNYKIHNAFIPYLECSDYIK